MIPAVASPATLSRSTITTLAPLLAKPSAVARPMPFPAPVISATLPVKSRFMASLRMSVLAPDLARPVLECDEQIANEPAPHLVREAAFGVELGVALADQHLGLVDRVHVEKDAAPAQIMQIILRPYGAGHPGAGPHDRYGL